MSEQSATTGTQNDNGGNSSTAGTPPAPEFTPITSQDDLNKVIADRIQRERAKFADYDDLKKAAGRLAELEQAQLSETEKAQQRIADLESKLTPTQQENVRLKVALEKGVPKDLVARLQGGTEQEIAEDADRLMALFSAAGQQSGGSNTPKPDLTQGARGQAVATGDPAADFAQFMKGQLSG